MPVDPFGPHGRRRSAPIGAAAATDLPGGPPHNEKSRRKDQASAVMW